jgi:hypothetical protein
MKKEELAIKIGCNIRKTRKAKHLGDDEHQEHEQHEKQTPVWPSLSKYPGAKRHCQSYRGTESRQSHRNSVFHKRSDWVHGLHLETNQS